MHVVFFKYSCLEFLRIINNLRLCISKKILLNFAKGKTIRAAENTVENLSLV